MSTLENLAFAIETSVIVEVRTSVSPNCHMCVLLVINRIQQHCYRHLAFGIAQVEICMRTMKYRTGRLCSAADCVLLTATANWHASVPFVVVDTPTACAMSMEKRVLSDLSQTLKARHDSLHRVGHASGTASNQVYFFSSLLATKRAQKGHQMCRIARRIQRCNCRIIDVLVAKVIAKRKFWLCL